MPTGSPSAPEVAAGVALLEGRGHGAIRWWILAVTAGGATVFSALRLGLPSLGPALRESFGLSLAQVGVVLAAIGAGPMVTLVPWGMLADRIGERPVLTIGLLGTAAALVATAFAPTYPLLVLAIFVAGAVGASTTGASGRAVMGWFGWRERGTALGIRQCALPVGGAVGAVALPALAIAHGIEAPFLALAVVAVLAAALCALVVREPPEDPTAAPAEAGPPPLRDARIARLSIGSMLLILPQVAMLGFLALFLVDEHGVAVGTAALVLGLVQALGAWGRFRAGRVSDRLGRRIPPMQRRALVCAGLLLVLTAVGQASLWLAAPVLVAACVATMTWNGLAFTAAAEISGLAHAGTAMAIQNSVVAVGTVIGPPVFGAFVEATSWPAAFALFALWPLGAWVVLRPLLDDERRRVSDHRERVREHAAGLAAAPDVAD